MLEENVGIDQAYELASRYYIEDQLEKSLRIIKDLLKKEAQNPKFNHLLAKILFKLGNYKDSLPSYILALKKNQMKLNICNH
ncbi:tetratricopeptide repeat protein [Prochlorococcus marinus]|uniref:Uncharacterized protein n=1 Tax=Prochlorococcus marinus XMU1408 TaxID=2213228 RepID=A0A318QXD0_PROMR|nr:hypothetical protein [Prochlorococcus marinus]MBW3042438.1 hypothetical protein [Prochlorococcus marinus str. XMU1408]PYE01175.1 hypothetical protein DNJ73_07040 [Prochlorococcus marinus XMU1408]